MSSQSSPQQQPPLNSLDEHFASFAARVEKIDEAIDVNDHQSLVTARGNLAEIILELEQLHIEEIDVASNSGEDAQSNRFLLTREIANLLHQTQQLYQVLDLTIEKSLASAGGSAAHQHTQQQQQQVADTSDEDNTPLAREEVAKLLLLVSRAHGIGQLTDEQKSNLKMEVCLRKSSLRSILKQQDITQIMVALAQAGGGS